MFCRTLLGIAWALLLPLSLQAQSESTASPSPLEVTVKPTGQQKQLVSLFTLFRTGFVSPCTRNSTFAKGNLERAMGIEQIQGPKQGVTARFFSSIGVKWSQAGVPMG
jgi:hypothetical protein